MPAELKVKAPEDGTYIVTAAFTDAADAAVVPNNIDWWLMDRDGNIINGREEVAVAVPAASIDILLSGDDLAISGTGDVARVVRIVADYDSDEGSNLPLIGQVTFTVEDLLDPIPTPP